MNRNEKVQINLSVIVNWDRPEYCSTDCPNMYTVERDCHTTRSCQIFDNEWLLLDMNNPDTSDMDKQHGLGPVFRRQRCADAERDMQSMIRIKRQPRVIMPGSCMKCSKVDSLKEVIRGELLLCPECFDTMKEQVFPEATKIDRLLTYLIDTEKT